MPPLPTVSVSGSTDADLPGASTPGDADLPSQEATPPPLETLLPGDSPTKALRAIAITVLAVMPRPGDTDKPQTTNVEVFQDTPSSCRSRAPTGELAANAAANAAATAAVGAGAGARGGAAATTAAVAPSAISSKRTGGSDDKYRSVAAPSDASDRNSGTSRSMAESRAPPGLTASVVAHKEMKGSWAAEQKHERRGVGVAGALPHKGRRQQVTPIAGIEPPVDQPQASVRLLPVTSPHNQGEAGG